MLKELPGFITIDISNEEWRAYMYDEEAEYIIIEPQTLYMKESDTDSHRVVDKNGTCHYISRGWVAITFPAEALGF